TRPAAASGGLPGSGIGGAVGSGCTLHTAADAWRFPGAARRAPRPSSTIAQLVCTSWPLPIQVRPQLFQQELAGLEHAPADGFFRQPERMSNFREGKVFLRPQQEGRTKVVR